MSEQRLVETGRVVSMHEGLAVIEISRTEACARCGLCHQAQYQRMRVEVRAKGGISAGSLVRVTFPYRSKWRPIFLVFALPLVLFLGAGLLTAAIAERLAWPEWAGGAAAAVGAIAGLALAIAIARWDEKRFCRSVVEDTIVEALEEPLGRGEAREREDGF